MCQTTSLGTMIIDKQNISSRILKTELIDWHKLQFIQQEDFKTWIEKGDEKLIQSLLRYQFIDPFKVWFDGSIHWCLDGFHRFSDLMNMERSGVDVPNMLPATFIDCKDQKEAAELVLVFSSIYAKITSQGLYDFIGKYDIDYADIKTSIEIPEFDEIDFQSILNHGNEPFQEIIPVSLAERFIIPPFSIFDSRQGYWQDRKKKWSTLFNSQETREDIELVAKSGQSPAIYELRNKMRETMRREPDWDEIIEYAKKKGMHIYEGASVFDPVLTEICYKWFCPEGGAILDPFAGGSVRGIVAGIIGCAYTGIDLRKEQVLANRKQWQAIEKYTGRINWIVGDSNTELDTLDGKFDFIFSCPPYHDLEQYSDDPADLSNMNYEQFLKIYEDIIIKSIRKLKDDRFACFVVGDIRDEKGMYRNFVSETIKAFQRDSECKLYNDIILINVAGSLPVRVGRQFDASRKVGKMHQNVLVFYKGDPKKIRENFPQINMEKYLQELNYQPNIAHSVID